MSYVGYYEAYATLFIAKVSCEHTFVMEGTMDDWDKQVRINKTGRTAERRVAAGYP